MHFVDLLFNLLRRHRFTLRRISSTGSMLPARLWALATLFFLRIVFICGYPASSAQRERTAGREIESTPAFAGGVHNQCWVFTHLQKAGGSTVRKVFMTRWRETNTVYDSRHWVLGEEWTASWAQTFLRGDTWDVVAGGYPEALRPLIGNRCKWFTMFRHPVSRLVSAYYYCQKSPSDPLCGTGRLRAAETDLLGFAEHWGNFALRQFALSMVDQGDVMKFAHGTTFGQANTRPHDVGWYILKKYLERRGPRVYQELDDEKKALPDGALYHMLQPACDLLRSNYSAVGILEHFDDSLALFNSALSMPAFNWTSAFQTIGVKNQDNMYAMESHNTLAEAWTNTEIKKYLSLDLLLYEHAVAVFNEQKAMYGI